MGKHLKYNDDKELKRMIQIFRSMNYNWSKEDEDYNNNVNEAMKDAELNSVEDCLEFFQLWFQLYHETRKNWE